MADWLTPSCSGLDRGVDRVHSGLVDRAPAAGQAGAGADGPSWDTFIVLIQLGAILAVVALYFQRLWEVVVRLPSDPAARRFALCVLVAFLPAVVVGLALHDFIKKVLFESPALICWSLIVGGVVLIAPRPAGSTRRATTTPCSCRCGPRSASASSSAWP